MNEVTADFVRNALSYDPATGELRWRTSTGRKRVKPGALAGNLTPNGYRFVGIRGRRYAAHKLAWVHAYGRWPRGHVDHIDGNPRNNALSNLREATNAQNCHNSRVRRDNSSGCKGVSWRKGRQKWIAKVSCNGRAVQVGSFDNPEDAAAAYLDAASRLHGEFFAGERAIK